MKKLRVFYNQNQQVNNNDSFSPSAGKPEKVLHEWLQIGIDLKFSKAASRSTIALAHDPRYVRDVLDLRINNGFSNKSKEVAQALPYNVGSMIGAACDSLLQRSVNASLTSGFHHACYDHGGGFCTFEGNLITFQYLKLHGMINKAAYLDLDCHRGNGCEDIVKKLNLDYIEHYTLGRDGVGKTTKEIFKDIKQWFKNKASKCDVIIIQLGADACNDDPLGGFFTINEMRQRDELVFSQTKKYNLCGAWNLAGGYQKDFQKVLDLHNISLNAWIKYYG